MILRKEIYILFCILIFVTSGCGKASSEVNAIESIYEIAESVYEQYMGGEIAVGEEVRPEDGSYLYAYMLTEDAVLIATDSLFQSVEGYIVNYSKDELAPCVTVSENLHYDGNQITLEAVEGYDNLYIFWAGI